MPDISQAYVAIIGATFGGGGLKVIEYWLGRGRSKDDTATQLRSELRLELGVLREQVQRQDEEIDKWKGKYYDLLDNVIELKKQYINPETTFKSSTKSRQKDLREDLVNDEEDRSKK